MWFNKDSKMIMEKIYNKLYIILLIVFISHLCSCSSLTKSQPVALSINDIIVYNENKEKIYLGMSKFDVEAVLGKPDKIGLSYNYDSGINIAYSENNVVTSIVLTNLNKKSNYQTFRGINISSSYHDVIAIYGNSFLAKDNKSYNLEYWFDPFRNITLRSKDDMKSYAKKINDVIVLLNFVFTENRKEIYFIGISSFRVNGNSEAFDKQKFIDEVF